MEWPTDMPVEAQKAMDETIEKAMKAWNIALGMGHQIDITYSTDESCKVVVACDTQANADLIKQITKGEIVPQVLCPHCNKLPCLSDVHYDKIVALGQEVENDSSNAEYAGWSNNTARFHIYSNMSREIFGHLGKGVRRRLPECVVQEVHDLYPAHKGTKYTGFKGVSKDVVD